MNKKTIAVVNIVIMALILAFVGIYSHYRNEAVYRQQVESFLSTAVTLERVTENYLEGEQGICDVWARYLNAVPMTMEDAVDFVRTSSKGGDVSAHLIDAETLTGLSTQPSPGGGYDVSYKQISLFGSLDWIADGDASVNITRAYTNPVNGEQSLAFCSMIALRDGGGTRPAILMRVIPLAELGKKWVLPQEDFESAELSMIDAEGNYIIKGRTFKNSNFIEFYKSYNKTDAAGLKTLSETVTGGTGTFAMTDSRGDTVLVAHTPALSTRGWTLLSCVSDAALRGNTENWLLIGTVSAGLTLLFIIDLLYMRRMNRQLQIMTREAESANKAKTDFLSTMSHDIRTPMNAIIGLTTIAEKNLGDPASVSDNLRKISLASNHLLTLINDILDISKVESGKLTLSPLTFSIVETVENLVNISQPMVKEKNIDFNFRVSSMETEYLYADQLRLNQVYINILSNALKYTEPGGQVSVDLRQEPSDRPGCVRVTYVVADTGMGMSPEFMARMYQPFSRQTDSRVNTIQGTGLGLAITKQMVELMGGVIDCQSELGKGTTFTITLDIPAAERQPDDMRLEPMDVLLVDDDEVVLETGADALTSLGARAETASSGLEAIGMIRHREESGSAYSVVILDWKMPGMDGVETVRRIRAEISRSVPILLISAYDWSDVEDEARDAGANGFISKPLFRSTLYEKINELLGLESGLKEQEDDYSDIAGMNILIAEDNDINWEIIHTILEMFGITTDRAANGRICVDMMAQAERGQYDLIFMDVQMPEMNGLDATRSIRALEDPWASSIPIIAMTADAFSENVAECMNAGMNGHIAKPIDIKLVVKEIRRIKEGSKQ